MYIDVIIPRAINKSLTYKVNSDTHLQIGQRILVPLGKSCMVGFVHKIDVKTPYIKAIKEIIEPLDPNPLLSEHYIHWLEWASNYYHHPLGEILKMVIPSGFWDQVTWTSLAGKKNRSKETKNSEHTAHELNPDQKQICLDIQNTFGNFKTHLLWGITGSGKTEVYLNLAAQALKQGKDVLVLVPEIGLTPQIAQRFLSLFKDQMALYHSGLTENAKLMAWMQLSSGEPRILIGTRSSLFAPFKNLGLIIVDEEHDPSYKQEDRFKYQARDMAIVRAQTEGIPVILGSATPSLESYFNTQSGKYTLHKLASRANQAKLPRVQILDWAAEKRQTQTPRLISETLHTAIKDTLNKKEQIILFINRRGFASSFFCLDCSKGASCPNCSVTLTYHRTNNKLQCHHCDYKTTLPKTCPDCHGAKTLLTGMGSQTIEDEIKTFFPLATIARMDRDNIKSRKSLDELLASFRSGETSIIIGTQMIAKGHDFPNVTLVGILGADFGMDFADFRANERTFQLLCQVTGRAGRGSKSGTVMIQTLIPEHPLMQLAQKQDFETFANLELKAREELDYPPYGHLAMIELTAKDPSKLADFTKNIPVRTLVSGSYLGPTTAPLEKIQTWHRQLILLKSKNRGELRKSCQKIIEFLKKEAPKPIKWAVDVDPMNML